MTAYETDFAALGLNFKSPFDIIYQPLAEPKPSSAPKKRGPRPTTCIQKTLAALADPKQTGFNTPITTQAQADRTGAIKGHCL